MNVLAGQAGGLLALRDVVFQQLQNKSNAAASKNYCFIGMSAGVEEMSCWLHCGKSLHRKNLWYACHHSHACPRTATHDHLSIAALHLHASLHTRMLALALKCLLSHCHAWPQHCSSALTCLITHSHACSNNHTQPCMTTVLQFYTRMLSLTLTAL